MNRLLPAVLATLLVHVWLFAQEWKTPKRIPPPPPSLHLSLETVARPAPKAAPSPPPPPKAVPPPPAPPPKPPPPKRVAAPSPRPLKQEPPKPAPVAAPSPPEPSPDLARQALPSAAAPVSAVAVEAPAVTPSPPPAALAVVEAIPRYRDNPPPDYPRMARKRGWEGTVTIQARVNETGGVDEATVHRSCGYESLDQAALEAVRGWRFVPGTRDGNPVATRVMVPVKFELK